MTVTTRISELFIQPLSRLLGRRIHRVRPAGTDRPMWQVEMWIVLGRILGGRETDPAGHDPRRPVSDAKEPRSREGESNANE